MPFPPRTLIVTNGDGAAGVLRQLDLTATLLPWADVLHEGPLPPPGTAPAELATLRARYLAVRGLGTETGIRNAFEKRDALLMQAPTFHEVILWFEHDLYDQLQLLQVLDRLSQIDLDRTPVTLICEAEFVSHCSTKRLRHHYVTRRPLTPAQRLLARRAWAAVCDTTPLALHHLLADDLSALPFLKPALLRLCEAYPSAENGLCRTEQQMLDLVAAGCNTAVKLFFENQRREQAAFLGDSIFWLYLHDLTSGSTPLLTTGTDAPFAPPQPDTPDHVFRTQQLHLTEAGRRVQARRTDAIRLNGRVGGLGHTGGTRWRGGVALRGRDVWRWDGTARRFVRPRRRG